MKRIILAVLVMCLLTSAFVGCAKETTTPTPEGKPTPVTETRAVIDDRGIAVEIPAEVKRVVTVCIPYAQIVWALDSSGERIVGMHDSSKVAVGNSMLGKMAPELMNVESGFTELGSFVVNVEELLKLQPDVVFQWTKQDKEIKKMEAAGITVIAATNLLDIDEVPHRLKLVGEVLGEEQRAAELITNYRETVETISSRTSEIPEESKPTVIHLYNVEQLRIAPYPWYETAGARYPVSKWVNATMEQILVWNPDIIYISNFCEQMPEDLIENKIKGQDWSHVEAVMNGRIYKVPLGTYRWGPWNAESALMLWWAAKIQHPDLFTDYTIEEKIRDFYSKFYNYDLSDEEIEWILHPIPLKG